MDNLNIYRYRPQHMKAELFHSIAKDLHMEGEFAYGDEGMVMLNDQKVLAWSQPNAKFGGVLFYIDRDRGLTRACEDAPDIEATRKYMDRFLNHAHLLPTDGKENVSVKLATRTTQAKVYDEKQKVKSVPMRVDISSSIKLDGLPVLGPRAKIRASFTDEMIPQFMHVGLWDRVEPYKKGELIPKDHLHDIIKERIKRRGKKIDLKVRDITLAYWAHEYRGGIDVLEPYYFVEIEHLEDGVRKDGEGNGPRQVLQFVAYH